MKRTILTLVSIITLCIILAFPGTGYAQPCTNATQLPAATQVISTTGSETVVASSDADFFAATILSGQYYFVYPANFATTDAVSVWGTSNGSGSLGEGEGYVLTTATTGTTMWVDLNANNTCGGAASAKNVHVALLPYNITLPSTAECVGNTITVTGNALLNVTSVQFSGGVSANTSAVTSTSFQVKIPAGAVSGDVTVTCSYTGVTDNDLPCVNQLIIGTASVTSYAPTGGNTGDIVTIAGTGLLGATNVKFNGVAATGVTTSNTQITCTVPAGVTTGNITFTDACGNAVTVGAFTVVAVTNYYLVAGGTITNLASWGTNTNGTGANPPNFTANGERFNIQNNATATLTAAWTVSGAGSGILVGDGTNPCNFTIPVTAADKVTGNILAVNAGATLTLNNTTIPTLSPCVCASASTVVFNDAAATVIPAITYGNLTISGTGTPYSFAGGCTIAGTLNISTTGTVRLNTTASTNVFTINNFTMSNGTLDAGTVAVGGNYVSELYISGNFNKTGGTTTSSAYSNGGELLEINFDGGGTQTFNINAATTNALLYTPVFVTNNSTLVLNSNFTTTGIVFDLNQISFLNVAAGSTLTCGTYQISSSTVGGNFTVDGTIETGNVNGFCGASNTTVNSSNSTTQILGSGSTVLYDATSAQTVTSTANLGTFYSNVTISTTGGNATASGALTLAGNLLISSGSTFDGSTYTHNITGNWTNNGTFTGTTSTINFDGTTTQTIAGSSVTSFYNLTSSGTDVALGSAETVTNNFAITAGTFDCQSYQLTGNATGTFTMSAGASLLLGTSSSANNVTLPTNFTTANTTLNAASTVTYQANTAQTVLIAPTYGNLIINNGAGNTTTPSGTPLVVGGNLTVNASSTLSETTNTINLTGNLTNNGTLSFTTGALNINGNFTNNATFTAGTNTVSFNGTAGQTIGGTADALFYNLTATGNSAETVTLAGAESVTNNFAISAGTFDCQTFQLTGNATGTFTMAAGSSLLIGATASATAVAFPTNFTTANTTLNATSTVTYQANTAQTVSNTPTYGNLIIGTGAAATTKTPGGTPIAIAGNLTVNASATLSETTNTINLTGNLTNNGTLSFSTGALNIGGNFTNNLTFTAGTSTVTFDGTANQAINGTVAAETFYNVIVNLTAGQTLSTGGSTVTITTNNLTMTTGNFTAPATLNINGTLTLTAGTLTAGTTINIQGNWTNNGGTFTPGLNLVKFVGTSGEIINGTAAAQTFYNVTVNMTAGQTLSTGGSTVTVTTNNLTETTGNFTAPATLNINGNLTLTAGTFTAGTTINIMGNWTATVAAAAAFVPGGNTVNFVGTAAQTINGTALAQTFSNVVVNLTAGQLLNTGGSTVTLTTTNLTETTGNFTAPATLNINGTLTLTAGTFTAGTTINIQGNWTNNGGTFTPGLNLVKFVGTSGEIINGTAATQTFYNVTVNLTAGQTLSTGGSTTTVTTQNLTETTGNFTAPATLNINGNLILTAGTLTAGTNINIDGNWTNNGGTFTSNLGTVNYNGAAGQTIGGTAVTSFYNLTATGNGAETVTLAIAQTITNNFAISAGTFDCQKYQITGNATGTFTMAAGTFLLVGGTAFATAVTFPTNFTAANITLNVTSTVTYQANIAQVVSNVPTYGNLIIGTGAAATTKTPGGTPLAIAGNLTVNATATLSETTNTINLTGNLTDNGTLSFSTGNFNIGGNFTNNSTYTAGTGTVTFDGTAGEVINGTVAAETFDNVIVNLTAGQTLSTGGSTVTLNINGNLTLSAGTFTAPATINIAGNWTNNGGTFTPGTNTVNFIGAASEAINGTAAAQTFYNVVANLTAGQTLSTGGSTVTVTTQNLTETTGNITAPATLNINGNLLISAGTLTAGTNINLSGNFTNNSVFTRGTGTVTFNGAAAQAISGTTATTFYNLTIFNSSGMASGVTPSIAVTVANVLTLSQGAFNLNGLTLTITNSSNAAISGGSATAYIVSENTSMTSAVQWNGITNAIAGTSFNYPFGATVSGTNFYLPFTFQVTTAAGAAGNVTLATYHTVNANTPLPPGVTQIDGAQTSCSGQTGTEGVGALIDRYWQITVTNPPTATITFTYAGPEASTVTDATANGGSCGNTVGANHWNAAKGSWDAPVGSNAIVTGAAATGTIQATGISTFSPWVGGLTASPLPITLLNFDAVYNTSDKDVSVTWKTASEINNKLFTVERSTDGINFGEIATQPGAGTSTTVHSYSTIDPTPVPGIDYYRLKQTDIDGNFTYSNVVPVNVTASEDFTLFPNPVSSIVNMSCYSGTNCSATIVVCDVTGKEVANFSQEIQKGGNTINLNVEAFVSGVYVVKAQVGSAIYVKKFLKL